ncbi:kinase-like domain, phloem protein 2-like protein [Tanacetum coccineum]
MLQGKNFEHLKIPLNDINQATNDFDEAHCIGSGGFGKVYKADLEHFDSSISSSIEYVSKCDLPRKRSTVAIKRINNQEGEQGFIAEIETLSSCKHDNIISLLGYCYEGNGAMILVYEHASKGSLENYLGSNHGKQKMIHRDIKSDNILLGDNWKAKIADFGLSKFHPADQAASTIYTDMIAGTYMYLDPEYQKYGKLNKKSDIYSFGVVLLEIFAGRLAYDSVYTKVNDRGIAPIARDHFRKGTIMKIVDHKIKEETDEHVFSLRKGPNKESLDIFLKIALRCVAETQAERPSIEIVIKELKRALNCQENHKDNVKLSLEDVKLATQDFSPDNIIGHGDLGNIYRGEVTHAHVLKNIAAKRLDKKIAEGEAQFATELEILMEYKHENVIGLVGYCTIGYRDPLQSKTGLLTADSDIFSLGAVLFDIMCGKISSVELDDDYLYLPFLAKSLYQVGKLDELVFEGIKEQIVPQAFAIFSRIAYQCLDHRRERRPTASEVIKQLKKALEFQEDYEIWEPKYLARDYREIFQMVKSAQTSMFQKKEELYNYILKKGIPPLNRTKRFCYSMNEDVVFEFLLESFSSHYCGESAVYVEGIEFRAIDKVKREEIGKLKEVQQVLKSNYNVDQVQQLPTNFEEIFKICRNYDELFWLGEVDQKKLLVLSAKAALYKFSNVDLFTSKPSSQSRFASYIVANFVTVSFN